jgi:hypothetical protein
MSEAHSPKRDLGAKLKLLGGMVRLGIFSAKELAIHANVKRETARAFANDRLKDGTLDSEHPPDAGPRRGGRPEKVYMLRADTRQRILDQIVEVRRSIETPPASEVEVSATDEEDFTPLALLETSIEALATEQIEDLEDRQDRLGQARIRLNGAEADYRAMQTREGQTEAVAQFAIRLQRAKQALHFEALRQPSTRTRTPAEAHQHLLSRDTSQSPIWTVTSDEDGLSNPDAVIWFLSDWSVTIQGAMRRTNPIPAQMFSGQHMHAGAANELVSTILQPCCGLMRSIGDWPKAKRSEFSRGIIDRLMRASISEAPAVTSLAIAAAIIEGVEAAEPILMALLRPGMIDAIGVIGVRLCTLALARLARPSGHPAVPAAAMTCFYLLNHSSQDEACMPILAPATLQLQRTSVGQMLNDLARTLYVGSDLAACWRSQIDESATMRNLAWVMHANRYRVLQGYIPELLSRDYSTSLLRALINPAHGALVLNDRDHTSPFVVSPGKILAEQAGLRDEPVALAFDEEVNKKLTAIRSGSNWDEQDRPDRIEGILTTMLADPKRRVHCVSQGGRA